MAFRSFAAASLLMLLAHGSKANPVNDIMLEKPESEQKTTFAELLAQSGKACGSVTRLVFKGTDREDEAYWAAACSNGKSWVIRIPANVNAKTGILECSIMEAMTGDNCFEKF